ncbi:MAG: hypothetical protein ACE5ES_03955 [Candidatus Nanoarchaeia archaeon]
MKPSLERRRHIIKRLQKDIYLFDEILYRNNKDWETDDKQCNRLYPIARRILDNGVFCSIEGVGSGGIASSQVIISGKMLVPGKFRVDYSKVLERAAEKISTQKLRQLEEEAEAIIKNYASDPNNSSFKKKYEELSEQWFFYNPDIVKGRLWKKLNDYKRKGN